MKRLTYVWSTIGLLILFAVFLMFQMPGMPAWGTVKLTDILMIIGGLLFIVPIYMDSLRRKDDDGARTAGCGPRCRRSAWPWCASAS